MYERYFGLNEKPFSLTPDPDFLFENQHFRQAFENILYGIKRQEGFTAIVGDVGTGKTTLCWALLGRLDRSIRTSLVLNPLLTEEDMLRAIIQDFGIRPPGVGQWTGNPESELTAPYDPSWMQGMTRKELIDRLNAFLLDGSDQDIFNILIIDEAQNLSLGVLEQLRILSNLETSKKKLLQIIFVGQLEFEQKLQLPQLRQLNQRITIRYALKPLPRKDMVEYIEHRLSIAGSKRMVGFTRGALGSIYRHSAGYPRLINILCDRALLAGYSEKSRVITARMVRKAARGLRSIDKTVKVNVSGSKKVLVPVLALLVLALIAALYFWLLHGQFPNLSVAAESLEAHPLAADTPKAVVERQSLPAPAAEPATPLSPEAESVLEEVGTEQPESEVEKGPESEAGKYLLQLHSLASRDRADAATAALQTRGYAAFWKVQETSGGQQWFVVYAGPYDSLEDARRGAAELQRREEVNPILRR